MSDLTILTGLVMLVGLVGIVLPVLPGLFVVLASTAGWAYVHPDPAAWTVFWVALVLFAAGIVAQYLFPGRRMRRQGVGTGTMVLAVLLAVVGFFVVPVVGAFVGFVLGVYLVELSRRRDQGAAWTATKTALRAVLESIGIELMAGFAIVVTWLVGVWRLGSG